MPGHQTEERLRDGEIKDGAGLLNFTETATYGGRILGAGATVPTDGVTGWASNALFMLMAAHSIDAAWYINVGDRTSCNFDALDLALA
jgi:hypothetical protein